MSCFYISVNFSPRYAMFDLSQLTLNPLLTLYTDTMSNSLNTHYIVELVNNRYAKFRFFYILAKFGCNDN